MKYPPIYDEQKWNEGLYFDSIKDTRKQEEPIIDAAPAPVEDNGTTDKLKQALATASTEATTDDNIIEGNQQLFSKLVFTISHEVPRNAVSFVIEALGGKVIWDEESDDPSITHTILDRPEIENRFLNRKYVQPQWVFDCLNKKQILDVGLYQPGAELPPHLSPFDRENEVVEGIGNDEREMEAGGDESGDEIDEEIRRIAMEADYAEGIAAEMGTETGAQKPELKQLKEDMKRKKKEELERMAAGQLQGRKMYIYKRLKYKENQKNKKLNPEEDVNEEIDVEALEEEEIFEEEEEEKQE